MSISHTHDSQPGTKTIHGPLAGRLPDLVVRTRSQWPGLGSSWSLLFSPSSPFFVLSFRSPLSSLLRFADLSITHRVKAGSE